jgi:hypothetical protein
MNEDQYQWLMAEVETKLELFLNYLKGGNSCNANHSLNTVRIIGGINDCLVLKTCFSHIITA